MLKREDFTQDGFARKSFFWIITLILLFLSFNVIKNYIIPLVSAFILSYLSHPLYAKLEQKMKKQIAAAICVVVVTLLLLVPMSLIVGKILQDATSTAHLSPFDSLTDQINSSVISNYLDLNELRNKGATLLVSFFTKTISYLPSLILGVAVTLFGMFYMLIHWDYLSQHLQSYIPFKNKKRITEEIAKTTNNIIYGYFLIAIIEFCIAAVGFSLAGAKYPFIFALLIALFAFLPGLGPFLVWGPLGISYLLLDNYATAIGVFITGLIISIIIDTFAVAKIVGDKSKINPLILLIGILGGVPLFGIFGFIIGPLILVYTIKLVQEGILQEGEQVTLDDVPMKTKENKEKEVKETKAAETKTA